MVQEVQREFATLKYFSKIFLDTDTLTLLAQHSYFVSYEAIKRALTKPGDDPNDLNLFNVMLAGGTAGMAMWGIAIPPDVIKSHLQGAPQGTYSGFLDCARKVTAKHGPSALFKGFGPVSGVCACEMQAANSRLTMNNLIPFSSQAMARAFPANAATFLGVEVSLKMMTQAGL